MGLLSERWDSLEELLIHQLQDLYDSELRMLDAFPKMIERAENPELKQAFEAARKETDSHIEKLERVFERLDQPAKRTTCQAMQGLIKEGNRVIQAEGDSAVIDAALIASAQRFEHYEIAGYGCVKNFAERIGRADITEMLQEILDDEGAIDEELTRIATDLVNPEAAASV